MADVTSLRLAIDARFATAGAAVFQRATDKIRRNAKRAMLAVVAYVTVSIKAFASFEEQMANVSTMLTDQTMTYLPAYGEAIKQMAMKHGEGTKTLSEGLYNILSASVEAGSALDVLNISVTAAKAGMTDTSTAAYAITGILNAYGLAAGKAGQVSDVLFSTVQKGQTEFANLAPLIGRVTSVSAPAGISLEQVSAALSTITRGGIKTEEAVTGLRQALIALQGSQEQAVKLAKEHEVVLSVQALKTETLTGMLDQLSGLSAQTVADMFKEVGARTALNALLSDQAGFLEDYENALNSAGKTQEAYEKMVDILAQDFRRLWQVIKITSVEVGSKFRDQLRELTKFLLDNKDKITGWASDTADALNRFILFMREDWKAGIKMGLGVSLELFRGFGKSLMVIMEDLFTTLFKNIGPWIKRSMGQSKIYDQLYEQARKQVGSRGGALGLYGEKWYQVGGAGGREREIELRKRAKEMAEEAARFVRLESQAFSEQFPTSPFLSGDTLSRLGQVAEETRTTIAGMYATATAPALGDLDGEFQKIVDKAEEWLSTTDKIGASIARNKELLSDTAIVEEEITLSTAQRLEISREAAQLRQMELELAAQENDLVKGFGAAWEDLEANRLKLGGLGVGAAESIHGEWVGAFQDMATEGATWSEAMEGFFLNVGKSFSNMMAQMAAEALLFDAISPLFKGAVAGIGGAFSGGGGEGTGFADPQSTQTYHGGGTAGSGGMSRMVDPSVFAFAPRLHNGLRPNEFPAILEQGERVTPKGESGGGVVINLNYEGLPMAMEKQASRRSGSSEVVDIWLKAADSDMRVRRRLAN